MTLVMDGVRRTSVVRPIKANVTAAAVTGMVPLSETGRKARRRAEAGQRYFTGFDVVRRPVASSPRNVLARVAEPLAVAEAVMPAATMPVAPLDELVVTEEVYEPRVVMPVRDYSWLKRPAAAMGLVATALIAAGTVSMAINTPRTITARADAERPAPAVAPATPDPAVAAMAAEQADLQKLLNEFAAGQESQFGIVVKDLKTGATATVNPDRQLTSASLYKLFVAQQIYRMIDNGQLTYGDAAGGGTGRNIDGCLRIMINISDNGCGRALGAILGWAKQDEALRNAGYTNTTLANKPQATSAHDVSIMLERIYKGTLNSPNSNQRFLDLLKDQRVNNRLPVGLPQGTVIAHKTGDLDGYVHDAGIVYGPKTDYLVVVTSGPWKTPGVAPAKFADLSARLWNFFKK